MMTPNRTPLSAFFALLCLLPVARADPMALVEQRAFRSAVDRVAESVVAVETVGGLERVENMPLGAGPTTGVVIGADGYVLSSTLAFGNRPSSILVRLADGSRHPARLVATDHNRMVVLLKIDVDHPLAVPQAVPREEIRVGQWALAVGRTFDAAWPNVSVGIVSARNRIWGKAIQTDAAVSPNNYGGPLVDVHGRVLGLLVPLSPQQGDEIAGVAWYDSGIGFAVLWVDLVEIAEKLKQGKDLYPGLMGVGFPLAGLYTGEPVVAAVHPDSPAARAGLKEGDRIVAIDGRPIMRPAEVQEEVGRRYAGQTLHVVALSDGERIERDVELAGPREKTR